MLDEKTTRDAWEDFQSNGSCHRPVRPGILASWQRSQSHKISVQSVAAPLLADGEFHRCRLDHAKLLHAARPAMEQGRELLARSNAMLLLTDPSGTILQAVGDARTIAHGADVSLQEGGRWNEAEIGTNAIGTAIEVGAPTQIHAFEHFCCDIQKWTCAAAPLRDPIHNDIIGIIDISGPAETFNPQSLAHAVAISHRIEGRLLRDLQCERELILRTYLESHSSWSSDEAVVFGRSGTIIHATKNAYRLIEQRHPGSIADGRLVPLNRLSKLFWRTRLEALFPKADLKFVTENDEIIGGILVLGPSVNCRRSSTNEKSKSDQTSGFAAIIGESKAMREACEEARAIAGCGQPILIQGETGVGKELFARAIYSESGLTGEFVPVNCGGLSRDLISSELFGYAKGAFTGADSAGRIGKFEAASGGMLCLDEIGELPIEFQPYFLRVLEDGVVYKVGSHKGKSVDVHLVSMTNRDLRDGIQAGKFRRDLYHRIAMFNLTVPPLRERGDDIVLLASSFVKMAASQARKPAPTISQEALDCLTNYRWPGNVRELRNTIQAVVFRCRGSTLELEDIPHEIRSAAADPENQSLAGTNLACADLKSLEKAAIISAVESANGNMSKAAKILGIARSTLYCRIEKFGLSDDFLKR